MLTFKSWYSGNDTCKICTSATNIRRTTRSIHVIVYIVDKEAVSPDGDSTTAPPSQASEHSETNSKQSSNGRPHPIDTALENQMASSKKNIFPEKAHVAAANNHNNEAMLNHHHKKQSAIPETSFSTTNDANDDDPADLRNKLESPTGSYDSNNSNANNVPGQITSMDITRMKKV